MKFVIALSALLTVAGCKDERPSSTSESGRHYSVECIDGVEYWTRANGYLGYMAIRVDPQTLSFVRCDTK